MSLEDLINECGELYEASEYERLIRKCDEVLEEYPDNPNAIGYKGISQYFLKDYDEALKTLERGEELYPDNYYIKNNLAMVYYDLGDYEKSLELCEGGLEIKDFDWLCENKLKALLKLDRLDEAKQFDRTFVHDFDLGHVLFDEKRYEESLEYCYERLKEDPNDFARIYEIKCIVRYGDLDVTPEIGDYYMKWIDFIEKTDVCPACGGMLVAITPDEPNDADFQDRLHRCGNCGRHFLASYGCICTDENPFIGGYIYFMLRGLNSHLKDSHCVKVEKIRESFLSLDDAEFNAFIARLKEIGYLCEPREGYLRLIQK